MEIRDRLPSKALFARLILSCGIAMVPLFGDPLGPGQVLIYSNFGPGGSFEPFGSTIGSALGGPNEVVGDAFTTPAALRFADAQLAMFAFGGTSAAVYLESNGAGVPGTILDTLVEQSPLTNPATVVTFDCQLCPLLSAGSTYWIVVGEGNGPSAWNTSNTIDNNANAVNLNGSVVGPWLVPGPRGAFEVDGTPVPEPGSIVLLGTALVGLSLAVRHKAARTRPQAPSSER
jgi:hypothetical protein